MTVLCSGCYKNKVNAISDKNVDKTYKSLDNVKNNSDACEFKNIDYSQLVNPNLLRKEDVMYAVSFGFVMFITLICIDMLGHNHDLNLNAAIDEAIDFYLQRLADNGIDGNAIIDEFV
ncbi:hypothetical protein RSTT_P1-003 (plasmid) [Candidatus Endomicrobiellum trichonymphae]|nr:hypothetical protein RSTT_P1-003 [Candidatus Endomicrobium trichonymphae]